MFTLNHKNKFIWLGSIFLLIILFLDYADPFAIVMAYFIESIVIGFLNFIKMLLTSREKNNNSNTTTLFKSIFFLVHYSFFIFVQSIFVFAMFGIKDKNISEPFNVIENFGYAFTMLGFGLSICSMIFVLILELFFGYIKPKSYKSLSAEDLFF